MRLPSSPVLMRKALGVRGSAVTERLSPLWKFPPTRKTARPSSRRGSAATPGVKAV